MRTPACALLLAAALACPPAAADMAWFPAGGWTERPDPVASPRARKGGTIRFNGANPPKSLNAYVDNNSYTRMMFSLMYEPLLADGQSELDFEPCLARRWGVSDDGREFVFEIDPAARWSDGVPVTADDVKWTFDTVTAPASGTGPWKLVLGRFESPEVVDRLTVRFRRKGDAPRDWRHLGCCGQFWVLPKHAFEGRDFNALELVGAPVGGAYRLRRVDEQVEAEYERVPGWWRGDRPSCRGTCNFDRIVMRYYAENENAFEALRKRKIDVYPVYSARIMSAETHGERFDRNWILRRRVRNHNPVGFQGFAMNMRRWPFDDRRVRTAMAKLVDRETMNRTMMCGEYFLQRSFYQDVYDDGHPCGNPLFLYDPDGAARLLAEAGFAKDPKTGNLAKGGREFRFTFLSRSPMEDKFLSLFDSALRRLGIGMEIVRKDFAEWMRDMDSFNFDMTWQSWGAGRIKSPETAWLSSEADRRQSDNTVGFKSAEVDRLIEAEKSMDSASERLAAYREIDRLVAEEVPFAFLWNIDHTRLLYWNKFGMPDTVLPKYSNEEGVLTHWWYDEDRARELDEAVAGRKCLPDVPVEVDYDAAMKGKTR
ncbi:MAG: ABC transporter substrate-binding protein [Kiritimatiellae bacterium]|nr:ABC transporter substrate-binding protein [Kiritimatiellia bacterium]